METGTTQWFIGIMVSEISGAVLAVPIIRIVVYWDLHRSPHNPE